MSEAGPTDQDINAALDALAAWLTRRALTPHAPASPAEAATVGAFLLDYQRARAEREPVADGSGASPLADAVHRLSLADREALAEEFEVSDTTAWSWAIGMATPHPEIAARVIRWCEARGAAVEPDTATRAERAYVAAPPTVADGSSTFADAVQQLSFADREALAEELARSVAVEPDTAAREHIPRGLLDGTES